MWQIVEYLKNGDRVTMGGFSNDGLKVLIGFFTMGGFSNDGLKVLIGFFKKHGWQLRQPHGLTMATTGLGKKSRDSSGLLQLTVA